MVLRWRSNSVAESSAVLPAEVIVVDDQQKAEVAQQATSRLLKKDKVDFMTGIVFSNILLTVGQPIFKSKTFYVSANAGPSQYAGEQCNPYFFNVAWQNDNLSEAIGKYVQDKRFRKVALVAPSYAGGKDAMTGFKRFYQGQDQRRDPHQARPARLRRRIGADPFAQARRGVFLFARRDGRELRQAVRRCRAVGRYAALRSRPVGRRGRDPLGRRAAARHVQLGALGARPGQRREQAFRRRFPGGVRTSAFAFRRAGLRRGAAHRRRGA